MRFNPFEQTPHLAFLTVIILLFLTQGCQSDLTVTSTQEPPSSALTEEMITVAKVTIQDDGTLLTRQIHLYPDIEEDDYENEECDEDGIYQALDMDWDDGDLGGFRAQVDAIARDKESFVVFEGLKVVLEMEWVTEDDADLDEQFDGTDGAPLEICDLTPKTWIDVLGFTEEDGTFRAIHIREADAADLTIFGRLRDLEDDRFTLLGFPIKFNSDAEIEVETLDDCYHDEGDDNDEGHQDSENKEAAVVMSGGMFRPSQIDSESIS